MSYFIMTCYPDDDDAVISDELGLDEPFDNWNGGYRFDVEIPEPIHLEIWEEDEGNMLPIFDDAVLLIREDIVDALREAGVDNMDVYEAQITISRTGEVYHNYNAVNVIGLVRAVNVMNSEGVDIGLQNTGLLTMFYSKLRLDETKIGNLLLFRLAENLSYIFVHESIKNTLIKKGFDRIDFVNPDEI
jgi:hypothetical protein